MFDQAVAVKLLRAFLREVAEELIWAVGLGPQFVGGPDAANTVDGVLRLWFSLVQQHGGDRKLAFRVVL